MVAPIAKPMPTRCSETRVAGAERAVLEQLDEGLRDLLRGRELALVEQPVLLASCQRATMTTGETQRRRKASRDRPGAWPGRGVSGAGAAGAARRCRGHGAHVYVLNRLKSSGTLDFGMCDVSRRFAPMAAAARMRAWASQHRTQAAGSPTRFRRRRRRGVAGARRRARGVRRRTEPTPTALARCSRTPGCWCPVVAVLGRGRGRRRRPGPRQDERHGDRAAHRRATAGWRCWRSPAPRSSRRGTRRPGRCRCRPGPRPRRRSRTARTPSWSTWRGRPGSWSRATTSPALAAGWRLGRVGRPHRLDSARRGMIR